MEYTIAILDSDKCELGRTTEDTLAAAKGTARRAVKEREYIDAGMCKVGVRDAHGECIYDIFTR